MGKLIAGINMTLDGFCDHTGMLPDDELHQHFSELLSNAGVILYGRITYQLMEYWRTIVANPTGNKADDEFAMHMDKIPKIVFSHTLKSVDWESATLAKRSVEEEILAYKQQSDEDILVGSRSLIVTLLNLGLIDELQLCIHRVIAGKGLPLFKNIDNRTVLNLVKTKRFSSGTIVIYYEPVKK